MRLLSLASAPGSWVAVLSGLDITGGEDTTSDLRMTLMVEWLMGELGNVSSPPSFGGLDIDTVLTLPLCVCSYRRKP